MKFLSSGKAFSKVAGLRDQIAEIRSELSALESAPLPGEEALERVRDWITSQQADRGIASHLVGWATSPERSQGGPRGYEGWQVGGPHDPPVDLLREVMRILCVIGPDLIEQSAKVEIDRRLKTTQPGPPLSERPKLRDELEKKLLSLEIKEEAEIEKLEAAGYLVHRRAKARPEIILGECG